MQPHDGRPEEQREPGSSTPPDDAGQQSASWSTPTTSGGDPSGTPGGNEGGWQSRLGGAGDAPTQQQPSSPPTYGQPTPGYGAQPAYGESSGSGQPTQNFGAGGGDQGYERNQPTQNYGQYQPDQPQQGGYGQRDQGGYGQPIQNPSPGQPTQNYGQPAYGEPSGPSYGGGGGYQPTQTFDTAGYGGSSGSSYGSSQPSYGTDQYGQTAYGQPGGDSYGQGGYGQSQPGQYGQTQYGEGQYGQPGGTPTPAKKGHLGRWLGIAGAVVVVGVVAILLFVAPGFVVSKVLDPDAVAQTITSQSQGGNGDYSQVSCPANEKVDKGNTFTCTAADDKQITVTITSGSGDYTWEPAN